MNLTWGFFWPSVQMTTKTTFSKVCVVGKRFFLFLYMWVLIMKSSPSVTKCYLSLKCIVINFTFVIYYILNWLKNKPWNWFFFVLAMEQGWKRTWKVATIKSNLFINYLIYMVFKISKYILKGWNLSKVCQNLWFLFLANLSFPIG